MAIPTLRQLQYLTAVVELKHFGQAATRCFVSQSTLSAGIQDLEHILDASLLERSNRKVLVTELGLEIANRAKQILSLSADLVDVAASENNAQSGRITMGIIPTISPFLLPKALGTIRKEMPNLELLLVEGQSEVLLEQLRAGQIDLALLAFPFDISGLHHQIFAQEQFWIALPKHHPLTKSDIISTQQLAIDELLLLAEGHCLREHALNACNLPITSHRSSVQGTSLYTLIEMVASGLGITIIPQMALNSDFVRHANISLRPLSNDNNEAKRELGLVWRPSYARKKTIDHLSEYFTEALR